jgi:vitamin B12 transporter
MPLQTTTYQNTFANTLFLLVTIGAFVFQSGMKAAPPPGAGSSGAVVKGQVTDPSGAGVPRAGVSLHSQETGRMTGTQADGQGNYLIAAAEGKYLLEVRAPGFAHSTVQEVVLRSAETQRHDVQLELDKLSTQVVVTATGTAQSIDAISKTLSIIGEDEIVARNEYSLAEALRNTPGLRVQISGGPGAFTKIKTRGLRNEDTSVLVDGWRLRDAAAPQGDATGVLGDLLAVNSERLEVLRGSGSSLYGTNAIGSAINIRTASGGGAPHGEVSTQGGSLGLMVGQARIGGGAFDNSLRYSGGFAYLNALEGLDGNDRARNSSAQGSLQYNVAPRTVVSARWLGTDSFLQLNSSPSAAPMAPAQIPSGVIPAVALGQGAMRQLLAGQVVDYGRATFLPSPDDPDARRAARFSSAAFLLSQRISPNAGFQVGYHDLAVRRVQRDGPGGIGYQPEWNNEYRYQGDTSTLRATGDLHLGRLGLLTGGWEYERESYFDRARDENPVPGQQTDAIGRIRQTSHSVYAQNQMRWFTDRLQVSAAGRIQSFALRAPQFEGGSPAYSNVQMAAPPNAYTADGSASYFFATGTKIRAHVGNGYRAPSLFERFGSSFFFGAFSPYGDPRLRPERSISVDAGVDQWLANSRVRLSATYFYTRLQEIVAFDFSGLINFMTDPYGRFGGYLNTGGGLSRGMEVSGQAAVTRSTDVRASYTYTDSQSRQSLVSGTPYFRAFGVSDHMFTLLVSQRVGKRVDITYDMFAASAYPFPLYTGVGTRAFRFDGPIKADLSTGYTVPLADGRNLRFQIRVDNLLNRTYYEDGFRTPGVTALGGVKYTF